MPGAALLYLSMANIVINYQLARVPGALLLFIACSSLMHLLLHSHYQTLVKAGGDDRKGQRASWRRLHTPQCCFRMLGLITGGREVLVPWTCKERDAPAEMPQL